MPEGHQGEGRIPSSKISVDSFFVTESSPRSKRGRPPKFGRPAQLVTLTLPDDVIAWLETVDDDIGWAIVKLHERAASRRRPVERPLVELAHSPGGRALILVQPAPFQHLPGVSIIPLSDGRGFLALQSGQGVANLEIAVIDRLEGSAGSPLERSALEVLRMRLREWRQEGIEFESRSIVIALRQPEAGRPRPRPLTTPRSARRGRGVA